MCTYKITDLATQPKGDPTMSYNLNYRKAMNHLAHLAESNDQPGYVRVQALKTIVRELSPSNPGQRQNHQALDLEPHPEPQLPEASRNGEPQQESQLSPGYARAAEVMRQLNEQAGIATADDDNTEEEDEPH